MLRPEQASEPAGGLVQPAAGLMPPVSDSGGLGGAPASLTNSQGMFVLPGGKHTLRFMSGQTGSSQITQEISKSELKYLPPVLTSPSSPMQHRPHQPLNPPVPRCKCILNIVAVYLLVALASPCENKLIYSEKGITIEKPFTSTAQVSDKNNMS